MERKEKIIVYSVEDDFAFANVIKLKLEKNPLIEVVHFEDGQSFLEKFKVEPPELILLDYNLPDTTGLELLKEIKSMDKSLPVIVLSGQNDIEAAIQLYKTGANDYIIKNENAQNELQKAVELVTENINLRREVDYWKQQVLDRGRYKTIIGESPQILKVLKLIQKVEQSDVLTLITGESGTGKDLVASAIHYNSKRRKKPFVTVNVAAIPDELVESELFGHEKGAFTDARTRRIGRFEEANGGSIFLDEIGEMDFNLQAKLLRVLQDSKITRLGGNKEIQLDIRIIVATNKNLSILVKEGKFREDLYYRLQGFLIPLPPLRERGNDVLLLLNKFVKEFCQKHKTGKKSFSKDTIDRIFKHKWPGNVRELKAFVERAVLISNNGVITEEDIIFSETI